MSEMRAVEFMRASFGVVMDRAAGHGESVSFRPLELASRIHDGASVGPKHVLLSWDPALAGLYGIRSGDPASAGFVLSREREHSIQAERFAELKIR
jgi:hypothetical protein